MQVIGPNTFWLFCTTDDMNILLQALGNYQGPWDQNAKLTAEEKSRKQELIERAGKMCNIIEAQLYAHAEMENKLAQLSVQAASPSRYGV